MGKQGSHPAGLSGYIWHAYCCCKFVSSFIFCRRCHISSATLFIPGSTRFIPDLICSGGTEEDADSVNRHGWILNHRTRTPTRLVAPRGPLSRRVLQQRYQPVLTNPSDKRVSTSTTNRDGERASTMSDSEEDSEEDVEKEEDDVMEPPVCPRLPLCATEKN